MNQSHLSVVLPVYNEAETLPILYTELKSVLSSLPFQHELIFVDDGSTDSSSTVIARLRDTDRTVKLISFSRNFGHQVALTAGLDVAKGDAVIMMDSDLQHPPTLIPALIQAWKNGNQIVQTVRLDDPKQNFLKKICSSLFYSLFRFASSVPMPQNAADFRLIDKNVCAALCRMRETHRFFRGLIGWAGFNSTTISYQPATRRAGISKYSWSKMIHLAWDGMLSFSTAPLKLTVLAGFLLVGIAFVYFVYILYVRFITHAVVAGWTSLILMVLGIGGLQLILMGITGLYIGKIFEEIKQRPLYIVKEALGLDE